MRGLSRSGRARDDPTIFNGILYSQVAAATLLRLGCGVTDMTDSSRCHFKRSHLGEGRGGTGVSRANLTLNGAKDAPPSDNLAATSSSAGSTAGCRLSLAFSA